MGHCESGTAKSLYRMIKSRRRTGHVARMEKWNAYRVLVGKPEGKKWL
jgi:hypothetical protein